MKTRRIFHLKVFIFLMVKFSVYLNRCVFVMVWRSTAKIFILFLSLDILKIENLMSSQSKRVPINIANLFMLRKYVESDDIGLIIGAVTCVNFQGIQQATMR